MAKFKKIVFVTLLIFLFVEILIVFPSKIEHEDEAEVRSRVEAQVQLNKDNEERLKRGEKPESTNTVAEQKLGGVHLVESQQGARDWELFATAAEGSQGAGSWKLHDVKVYFYNHEKIEFTVTGETGTIDSKTKNLSVIGNVVTRSENGYIFKTPSIFYSSLTRLIESPEDVLMQGPREKSLAGIELRGRKMKLDVDKSRMQIQERIMATKPQKDGKKVEIIADGAEFSGKTYEAKFKGSVRLLYDGMRMEGPEALFAYEKNASALSSIAVLGGVKVSDVDKFATSETVNLDLLTNKYVFKGRPKVIQNNDEMTGEEIIFLDGGKKVKVERVRARVENKEQ